MKTLRYLLALAGVLMLVLVIFYEWLSSTQNTKPTPTCQSPAKNGMTSPGVSQDAQNLPTVTPRPPGVSAPEVNPRQRSTREAGNSSQAAPPCPE